jgi:hypothetical protein
MIRKESDEGPPTHGRLSMKPVRIVLGTWTGTGETGTGFAKT